MAGETLGRSGGYTPAQMVAEAEKHGFKASERLISDWAELGLLDVAEKSGRGRARGIVRTRSEHQLDLFLSLLRQRQHGINQVGTLANVPVFIWLNGGDSYVPVRQIVRALRTWSDRYAKAEWSNAKGAALGSIAPFIDPAATDGAKEALRLALAAAMNGDGRFDRLRVESLLRAVIDPEATGRAPGPSGANVTPEGVAALLAARFEARARARSGTISEAELRDARMLYLYSHAAYAKEQPGLAADFRSRGRFAAPALDEVASRACLDLLTAVGLNADRQVVTTNQEADGAATRPPSQ
ncbi:MAG: hypothetical protein P4L93_09595 [Coriobacteriia bacterium]|nr:hypothetical protein [Coriobacteriia bacterium]